MPTSVIASGSTIRRLASGHPKLNRDRMDLKHPVAFFPSAPRTNEVFDAH